MTTIYVQTPHNDRRSINNLQLIERDHQCLWSERDVNMCVICIYKRCILTHKSKQRRETALTMRERDNRGVVARSCVRARRFNKVGGGGECVKGKSWVWGGPEVPSPRTQDYGLSHMRVAGIQIHCDECARDRSVRVAFECTWFDGDAQSHFIG